MYVLKVKVSVFRVWDIIFNKISYFTRGYIIVFGVNIWSCNINFRDVNGDIFYVTYDIILPFLQFFY